MVTPAKAITVLLQANWPNSYCRVCLMSKLRLAPNQISEGTQALALLPEFRLIRLRCGACGREAEMLQMALPEDQVTGHTP